MTFSSSRPRLAANASTLMRHERAVRALADQRLDRREHRRIGRVAERAEQRLSLGLRIVHGPAT